jgi:glycosyltransferase involved in cell wall biosynthesis
MDSTHAPAKVAIIIRTKDRPTMLRRALKSITGQTFRDWQAIIVNDGGAPEAIEAVVLEQDTDVRPRITTVHNPASLGRWPAANLGVEKSDAPLIVLHDDDDSWHPDFLTETFAFLSANPDEVGVIARTEVLREEYDGEELHTTWSYLLEKDSPSVLLTDLLDFNRFVPISFLYRRTLHEEVGLYEESMPAAADWVFNMKVLARQPLRYVSDRVLAYWHQRPDIDGVLGNSVFAAPLDHRIADAGYRDDALRAYVQHSGPGLPLYLAQRTQRSDRAVEERITATEQRLEERIETRFTAMQEAIQGLQHHLDRTIDARLRGWVWRQKARVRNLRARGR